MDKFIMILSSSAFSVIMTLLFNWAQNRKNNLLNYITEERKIRVERIRKISSKIAVCQYEKKDIEQYLVRLKMNINPYGKANMMDYLHDGHIWAVIKKISNSKNSKEFERNKQLLLKYLNLMLKEEWERSKREVQGYSNIVMYIVIEGVLFALYAFIYFYIFKLENYMFFIMLMLLNVCFLLFTKFSFLEKINMMQNKKSLSMKKVLKIEKKIKKARIVYVMLFVVCFISNIIIVFVSPRMITNGVEYFGDGKNMYIYTKLDGIFWENLEGSIEKYVKEDVIWVKEKKDFFDNKVERTEEMDKIIRKAISENMVLESYFIIILSFAILILGMSFLENSSIKEKKFISEIERLKYDTYEIYKEDYKEIVGILDRICFEEKNKKKNDEYLWMLYKIFLDLLKKLNIESSERKNSTISIKNYDEVKSIEEKIEEVSNIIKEIKKMGKKRKIKKQNSILEQVKKDVENLKLE